jgi:hypothetical protein
MSFLKAASHENRAASPLRSIFNFHLSNSIFQMPQMISFDHPWLAARSSTLVAPGGEYRIRTDDPLLAKQVL